MLERRRASERDRGYALWAVERKDDGTFIGQSGLYPAELTGPEIELAYHYTPASWGQGYATEAVTAVLGYAFGMLRLERIIALVMPDNLGSSRVAEKAGMALNDANATYYGIPGLRKYVAERDSWERRSASEV
jgi:ribosomal-protein-alanine N-acetyltransferase